MIELEYNYKRTVTVRPTTFTETITYLVTGISIDTAMIGPSKFGLHKVCVKLL